MIDLLKRIEKVDKKKQAKIARKGFIVLGTGALISVVLSNILALGDPQDRKYLVRNPRYARLSQWVNSKLTISEEGRQLIETYEGKHLEAYLDPIGIPTIGYGHTKNVKMGQTITEQQAIDFLNQDIKKSASGILTYINTPLTQEQYDALVSFHFNLGADILASDKILLDAINSNNWALVKKRMMLYVNADGKPLEGLVKRRQAEVDLMK